MFVFGRTFAEGISGDVRTVNTGNSGVGRRPAVTYASPDAHLWLIVRIHSMTGWAEEAARSVKPPPLHTHTHTSLVLVVVVAKHKRCSTEP